MKRVRLTASLLVLAATCVALWPSVANAVSIEFYRKMRAEQRTLTVRPIQVLRARLIGVYDGLDWANSFNKRAGGKPLFCPPGTLKVNATMVIGMIDAELGRDAAGPGRLKPNIPVEFVILLAARRRWPCR